jgi:Phospholipase_D-nuclease N-terminal
MDTATCRACRSVNHAGSIRCLTCGAPLSVPSMPDGGPSPHGDGDRTGLPPTGLPPTGPFAAGDLPAPPVARTGWSAMVPAAERRPLSMAPMVVGLMGVVLIVGFGILVRTSDGIAPGVAGLGAVFWAISIGAFLFWLWMLIDVVTSSADPGSKVLWVLLIVFLGVIGAIAYAIMGRPSRRARY